VIRFGRIGWSALVAALAVAAGVCAASAAPPAASTARREPAAVRAALIGRWTAANHRSPRTWEAPPSAPAWPMPPLGLRALAARELATAGRYRLAPERLPAATPNDPWWLRAFDWLRDRWTQLWNAAFLRARLGRGGAIVIGDLLIAAAVLVILFVSYRLLAEFAFERRSRRRSLESIVLPADARALYAGACERARHGEYGAASRLLFAAAISALALRGVVRDDRSATVGEFRNAVRRGDAGLVSFFDAVAAAFVTSAYAELPVEAAEWERARRAYLALAQTGES
jgi:hypothetical protein